MKAQIQKFFLLGVVSLVTVLGSFSTAEAAIVRGRFDPAFGAPFDGTEKLGWQGTVEIYVPNACLAGTGIIDGSSACNNNIDPALRMHTIGASVDLYNLSDSPQDSLENFEFSPSALFPFALNQISVSDGVVTGIGTDYSVPVNPDESTFANINAYSFALGFDIKDGPTLLAMSSLGRYVSKVQAAYDISVLWDTWFKTDFFSKVTLAANDRFYDRQIARAIRAGNDSQLPEPTNRQFYSFNEVPEPASLALMLGALIALGATSRRRVNPAD